MGWLSDKLFGKKKSIDMDKIENYMKQSQGLLDNYNSGMLSAYGGAASGLISQGGDMRQAASRGYGNMLGMIPELSEGGRAMQGMGQETYGMGQSMMDPNSGMNQQMFNRINQQAANTGAQSMSQTGRLMAQGGVNPALAAANQRMTQNQIGRGTQNSYMDYMQGARTQGMNAMNMGAGMYGQGTSAIGSAVGQYGTGMAGMMGAHGAAGGIQAQGVDAMGGWAQGGLLGAQMQQGMDENVANAYMGNINASNASRASNMGMLGSVVGGFLGSDKKLKENIELVGTSPKGYNIYEFDYKDKSYGNGRYRGVMAQEVPEASININGTLMVNYDKLDVVFERIS